MIYKYKLKEVVTPSTSNSFQEQRIQAFEGIESKLDTLKKYIAKAKLHTIRYYRENPDSYNVLYGTDLADSYIKDLFTLFKDEK